VQAQLQLADEHLRMARTEEALAILNRYAAEGNPRAMVSLAVVYRDGYRVPADIPKAMEWLNKAAAEGYAPAFVHLGYASEIGSGLAQDYDQAVNQYGKAARQGHMTGLYCLGVIHARGVRGFPPNPVLAHFLLDLAHRAFEANPAGDAQAPDRKSAFWASGELRELAQKMSPVDIVKARELADAWRPGQPFPG
jgi:TPR repeat protein